MRYDDSERALAVAERTRAFVDEAVIPVERDLRGETRLPEETVATLNERARDRDVFGPGIPEEYGGLGLDFRDQVPVIEAAGRSRPGAAAVHAPPWPDEAGLTALRLAGTDDQKAEWLGPLARGEVRTALSITEPIQGAGSDPTMTGTTATRDGDEWVIDGHKWWVTGGSDADVIFVFARSDEGADAHRGISCFVVPAEASGIEVARDIAHMSDHVVGEPVHSEIVFDGVRVPAENVLGDPGDGFRLFQRVVDRSRVWLGVHKIGMASRALDIAKAYAEEREGFGGPLSEKQALRFEVAEAETKLHAVRLMARDAARKLTADEPCRTEVAMFKYHAANAVQEVIDTAVQACGANGIGEDLPLSDFYTNVRAYRIYDGADAVHKLVIAREAFEDTDADELAELSRFGEPRYRPSE